MHGMEVAVSLHAGILVGIVEPTFHELQKLVLVLLDEGHEFGVVGGPLRENQVELLVGTASHVVVLAAAAVEETHELLRVDRRGEHVGDAFVCGFADGAVGGGQLLEEKSVLVVELLHD